MLHKRIPVTCIGDKPKSVYYCTIDLLNKKVEVHAIWLDGYVALKVVNHADKVVHVINVNEDGQAKLNGFFVLVARMLEEKGIEIK